MSFFVARALSRPPGQDRADVFARGETAVLVVADGAGGVGDGGAAADVVLDRVRAAVLDVGFDLLAPARWSELLRRIGPEVKRVGESTVAIVVVAPGILVHAAAGDSEARVVGPTQVEPLTKTTPRLGTLREAPHLLVRRGLGGRLVVASDGLFRHAPPDALLRILRTEKLGRAADMLVELAGDADDVAVLVGEG